MDAASLKDAQQLELSLVARSPGALALVEAVTARVEAFEHSLGRRMRGASGERAKLRQAVSVVLAGSLRLWSKGKPWFRSRSKQAFTGAPVGVRQFRAAVDGMTNLGLLRVAKGIRFVTDHFEIGMPTSHGRAARHWPSEPLLALAVSHGVTSVTVRTDFGSEASTRAPKVAEPLVLERLGSRGRLKGPPVNFDPTDEAVTALLSDIARQNRLAEATQISGCLPPRWKRCFKVDWALYGRWHAVGADGNYQRMPEDDRLSRITINGEPVVEVDIGASHLSLMHGLMGLPLPPGDLYAAVPEFPRDVVKTWVTATLGKGSPVKRWPKGKRVSEAVSAYDPMAVGEAVMARYPFLRDPTVVVRHLAHLGRPKRILTHHLMFKEAQIVTTAMVFLCGPDHPDWPKPRVLALPMHDGLIVPASAVDLTLDYLWRAGAAQAGIVFRLKVSRAGLEPSYPEPPNDLPGQRRVSVASCTTDPRQHPCSEASHGLRQGGSWMEVLGGGRGHPCGAA
jgi:hypothetical protein